MNLTAMTGVEECFGVALRMLQSPPASEEEQHVVIVAVAVVCRQGGMRTYKA